MLIIAKSADFMIFIKDKALSVLDAFTKKATREWHFFDGWEFAEGKPAFTHTIAYTIRDLLNHLCLLIIGGGMENH